MSKLNTPYLHHIKGEKGYCSLYRVLVDEDTQGFFISQAELLHIGRAFYIQGINEANAHFMGWKTQKRTPQEILEICRQEWRERQKGSTHA